MSARLRLARFTAPLGAALFVASAALAGDAAPDSVGWNPDPSAVVVRLADTPSELADDPPRLVEIFGDGSVRVRLPSLVDLSTHEGRLTTTEMASLVRMLVESGLLDFDAEAARRAVAAERAELVARARKDPSVALHAASDPDATLLEVDLRVPDPATPGALVVRRNVIAWTGLRADARFHADVPGLAALAEAQAEIWRIARETP